MPLSLLQTCRTLSYLSWAQVLTRLERRLMERLFQSRFYITNCLRPGHGLPARHTPPDLWPGDKELGHLMSRGQIRLINHDARLSQPMNWDPQDQSYLWRFSLHYFEWLADLRACGKAELARTLIADWLDRFAEPDELAWHPYPLSLRLYAWLRHSPFILDGADTVFAQRFWDSLDRQGRHLPRALESDIGGNHLIKNLKALIACSLCLPGHEGGEERWLEELLHQITRQILPDGGHFERSPSYHKQVLADLMDVSALLTEAKREIPEALSATIAAMRTAFALMLHPDGRMALFNDGFMGQKTMIEALGKLPKSPDSLPDTGYFRLSAKPKSKKAGSETVILCDAGPVCPDELPAHAHADVLSFEMSTGEHRLVVNCGTYAYQDPVWRPFLRSTPAHSTLCIDGINSAEVYSVFRVGRRPKTITAQRDGNALTASHDGYRHLGLIHERTWDLINANRLEGRDVVRRISGKAPRFLAARFHLHPRVQPTLEEDGSVLLTFLDGGTWRFRATGATVSIGDSVYAPSFGHLYDTHKIKLEATMAENQPECALAWCFEREV
ncbi:MAG: hypothetical protein A2516_07110 [Alphaproteobacteria bacterium RIFOXYD12_FULL_60_8]|nr:MAG: hypothetical protein A2516_07110 [Alphaproteobacteria bacterium RIFOXYD12_FULL_60_8]